MIFDRIAILDWSAANQPRRGKDSIWLGLAGQPPENLPTRAAALARLQALVAETLAQGQRLLIGADFAFGYPSGFARALTGQTGALAIWDWLDARLTDDDRNRSNRFAVAATANAALPGLGPFWFNPTREALPDLPHKGNDRLGHGWPEHRLCDARAKGAQSVWKLGGAGAVGSQSVTGLPRLNQLRRRFPGAISVWPFEDPTTPVILAEVFPSILAPRVAITRGIVRDAAQVMLLSRALAAQPSLAPLLTHAADPAIADEGWILGLGHEAALLSSLL